VNGKPMKEAELRKRAVCGVCDKKIGESGVPLFYVVRIERHGLNIPVLRRQHGFGIAFGAGLAQMMGADEDMTVLITEPLEMTVCERCSTDVSCVAELAVLADAQQSKKGKKEDE
jgi:hypothetical protein